MASLDYNDPFIALGIKRLQLKCYFELADYDLLDSAINAFRVYQHRLTKLDQRHKQSHLEFVNQVSALFKARSSAQDSSARSAALSESAALNGLPEREWILKKWAEFNG